MCKEERGFKNARVSPSGSRTLILSLTVLVALSLVVSHCGPTPEATVREVVEKVVVEKVVVETVSETIVTKVVEEVVVEVTATAAPTPGPTPFDRYYESQDAGGLVCEAVEGVTVTLPWDYKVDGQWIVDAVKLPLEKEGPVTKEDLDTFGLLSNDDDFLPSRLVINFEIVDANTGELLTDFDHPIRLQVALTEEEQTYPDLALGFWHETAGQWVAFTTSKHGFTWDDRFGYATLSGWGDRRIGAGQPE
jgi:hypothetical protein